MADYNAPFRRAAAPVQIATQATPDFRQARQTEQLAQSLKALRPALQDFLVTKDKVESEEDLAKGRAASLQNAMSLKDAVRSGKISPDENPYFIRGYLEQSGRVASQQYQAALTEHFATAPEAQGTDPAAALASVAKFRKEWLDKNTESQEPDYLNGLLPRVTNAEEGAMAQFNQAAKARIHGQKEDKTMTEIVGVLSRSQDMFTKVDHIRGILEMDEFVGMPRDSQNKAVVKGFITAAMEQKDPKVLEGLMGLSSGTGKLGNVGWVREEVRKAQISIQSQRMTEDRESRDRIKFLRSEGERDFTAAAMDALGNETKEQAVIAQFKGVVPDAADQMRKFRSTHRSDSRAMDVADIHTVMEAMRDDYSSRTVARLFSNGVLRDPELAKTLMTPIMNGGRRPLDDDIYKSVRRNWLSDNGNGALKGLTGSDNERKAMNMFDAEYLRMVGTEEWINMPPLDRQKWLVMKTEEVQALAGWDREGFGLGPAPTGTSAKPATNKPAAPGGSYDKWKDSK